MYTNVNDMAHVYIDANIKSPLDMVTSAETDRKTY